MKVWIDFENTPQVHFLLAIQEMLKEGKNEFIFSARDVFETIKLLRQKTNFPIRVFGKSHGKNFNKKLLLMFQRFSNVFLGIETFDLSISCGSESAIWTSALRGKRSIAFGDNDTARQWTYGHFVDFCFFPRAINTDVLTRQGIKGNKLYQYNGYKEDIYIALYRPDYSFLETIPFKNYVLVRPENIYANYIRKNNVKSISPELLTTLIKKGFNIVYLPKYKIDFEYIEKNDKLFIPSGPINGLDACYFADAVLTGAGTFAREAASLGIPSVSFYAGKDLLAVDKSLIEKNRIFYSRNVDDIISYIINSNRFKDNSSNSMEVYLEVKAKLEEVISNFK
jgi:uncharacterized protein